MMIDKDRIKLGLMYSIVVWLRWNIQHSPGDRSVIKWPWLRVFGLFCWLIWKNRCKRAFEGTSDRPQQILHRGIHFLHEGIVEGQLRHKIFKVPDRISERWIAPPDGFIRIDVDAAVDKHRNSAVGGVIRDSSGHWICGFQQNIGISFGSTAAEVQAIQIGLKLCKSLNFANIQLFSNSTEALQSLLQPTGHFHPLQDVIDEVREFIYRDWDLEIHHSHREALRCADYLAKMALDSNSDLTLMQYPPDFCLTQMLVDMSEHLVSFSCNIA